jgi:hypothetical protein
LFPILWTNWWVKKIRDLAAASRSLYSSELQTLERELIRLRKERSNVVASIRGANKLVSVSLNYNASLVLHCVFKFILIDEIVGFSPDAW